MTSSLRKTLLLTTACVAGLALAAPAALAQKDAAGMIQPKGGWAVTKIDESNTQGGAYCTLARQFQNGVVFSIGRNKAEEYSIAIDFQDSKLNAEKAYDITLKAGNQTRQLQMMPVSARAMVIRLGWDDSFFAALEKSQTLAVTLDKEAYSFAMPEYTKGKADLSRCMDTLKSADMHGGTDVLAAESGIAAAGFSATKSAQGAAPASAEETPSAPTAIGKADPTKRPEKTNITQLDTPEVAGLSANDKAAYVAPTRSTDVSALRSENEKLRQQLNEQRQAYEARMTQGNQGNRVAELEEKLRLAEQRGGGAAPSKAAAIAPVPAPVPAVKEVVKEVPDAQQAQKIAALEQRVASLTQELNARNDVTIKPATTPMPNPEQAKRITELQEQVNTLKTQLSAAQKTPAAPVPVAASAGASQAEKQVAVLQAELEKKETMMRASQQRVAGYEGEIAQLRRQVDSNQRAAGPAPANDAAVQRLQQENASLREQVTQQKDQYERRLASASQQSRETAQAAPAPVSTSTPAPRGPSVNAAASSASIAPVAVAAGGSGLKSILSRAGIQANAGSKSGGASEAYQWKAGALAGSAQAYANKGNAQDVSQQYAGAQRNACSGDFASVPGPAQNGRVSLDIACVDGGSAKAQSLLFAEQGGQVLAFIIESSAEDMDQAMDARDRLGGNL